MAAKQDLRQVAHAGSGRQDWDPTDPGTRDDPHATYARLRRECPVAHSTKWGGFWTLTRYADVISASRDAGSFTATKQTVIPASPRKGLPRLPLQADPPEHDVYRKALNPYFKDAQIRRLKPRLRQLAADLLDGILADGVVDITAGYTEPFAVRSLCVLVGLDESEASDLASLSTRYVEAVQGTDLGTAGTLSAAVDRFAIDLVADRKANPRDVRSDMASGLLQWRDGERTFSDEEVAGMIRLLLIGGHTVPRNFLGSAVWHCARDPALQQMLRAEPDKLGAAVEEFLRLYSPNQALVRTTTREVEIGGQNIPAGEPVALLFISANRDEDVFVNPDAFDPTRMPRRHIAFGFGTHACIGQALARLQAQITLSELLAMTTSFETAGEVHWAAWTEYGVRDMRLKVDRAHRRGAQ